MNITYTSILNISILCSTTYTLSDENQDALDSLALNSKPSKKLNVESRPPPAIEDHPQSVSPIKHVEADATDLSKVAESAALKPTTIEPNSSDSNKVEAVRGKSPATLLKSSEARHFQKTRSFSAVEETPDKTLPVDANKLEEFPFKDVSHSRSEQLGMPQQQGPATCEEDDEATPMNSKACLLRLAKDGASAAGTSKDPYAGGETLIMQFDYDQPMSLQHDGSNYSKTINEGDSGSLRTSGCSNLRKSGRDLTEFEAEATRDRFEKSTKSSCANSRPRLELTSLYQKLFSPIPSYHPFIT